ncbi:unnamed protein product, partial [Didymodactylos carnosus]
IPRFSSAHPIVPLRYIEPWRREVVNRKIISNNAYLSGIPNFEHDDSLYLNKREQLFYNVEDRERVDSKYCLPSRCTQLQPLFHEPIDRFRSSLFSRYAPSYARSLSANQTGYCQTCPKSRCNCAQKDGDYVVETALKGNKLFTYGCGEGSKK